MAAGPLLCLLTAVEKVVVSGEPGTLLAGVREVSTISSDAERALGDLYAVSYARLVGVVGAPKTGRRLRKPSRTRSYG